MKNKTIYTCILIAPLALTASSNAASIVLINADFMSDTWAEEQFIQNNGTQTGAITGWTTEGLVRGFNLDIDGDGDPTMQAGARIWSGWATGDGLRQVGFQNFQATQNALSQDAGSFIAGDTYTFSIDVAPGFEGSNQTGFAQIRSSIDDSLLAETTFPVMNSGSNTSQTFSVSYIATAADTGAVRVRFGTDTSVNNGGTAVLGNPVLETSAIPEPSSIILLGFASLAGAIRRRR